mgnify:CR=1 FL=1
MENTRYRRGFAKDVHDLIPNWEPQVIFDIGANVGQTAVAFTQFFPKAFIYSFEPVPKSFQKLNAVASQHTNVRAFQIAFGDYSGTANMTVNGTSTRNCITLDREVAANTAEVSITTGVEFMEEHQLEKISFLKVDAEGFDLRVLKGFSSKLADIDFVQVEAGMNSYNQTHVALSAFSDYLSLHNFYLFKIYNQVFEFSSGRQPLLRRSNPVFVNGRFCDLQGLK